jgi:hypothetical protein
MTHRIPSLVLIICGILLSIARLCAEEPSVETNTLPDWPAITHEARPWSYWWWPGSAVDRRNLTRELECYRKAGWGGMHIIPIYGVKGRESQSISYLSPEWMTMLAHTASEARRLGMEVDMTTGTGWCFGGPSVVEEEAASKCVMKRWKITPNGEFSEKIDPEKTQTLAAFDADGRYVDLTAKIVADGRVDWQPGDKAWTVYAISQKPSSLKVKRAAPGGAGFMLDPFSASAMTHYLVVFEKAFSNYDGVKPRSMYHDSFEYDVNWSRELFEQFEKRRGYRLQSELPALFSKEPSERSARVKSDYRETLSDMLVDNYLPLWTAWCTQHGIKTRNQAHGSPGNLLDLYALSDIPETEMFARSRDIATSKFASSAAHVAGRKLTAAETGTWLKEHFHETLADVKYIADDMFLAGVNHIFFHGSCYSPDDATWPGWVFYASTEMNWRNPIWRDMPTVTEYIARCQSVLQSGTPDNDLLIYWPIFDLWHDPAGMQMNFGITSKNWFITKPVGALAEQLQKRGFAFDYISDRQLLAANTNKGTIATRGGNYRAVVVPSCEHIPVNTAEKLLDLAHGGAAIVFAEHLPENVPGWKDFEQRREELRKLFTSLKFSKNVISGKYETAQCGKGLVIVGDVESALAHCRIARESMSDHPGLQYIRRRMPDGRYYFIANRGEKPFQGMMTLAMPSESVMLMDPLTGRRGAAKLNNADREQPQLFVQLQPDESIILRTFYEKRTSGDAWQWWQSVGKSQEIVGRWQVEFIEGGADLPAAQTIEKLVSWTTFDKRHNESEPKDATSCERFAGTARYTIHFDAPVGVTAPYFLDLGNVRQSARVRLNGRDLGVLITPPFRMPVESLKPKDNLLEVEVTNLAANRIRDLDRRKVEWKIFHDINIANLNYRPLDASNWPLADSGLLGPVTLTPAHCTSSKTETTDEFP